MLQVNYCKFINSGMRNFQDTIETPKRSFISAFSMCMTLHLSYKVSYHIFNYLNLP